MKDIIIAISLIIVSYIVINKMIKIEAESLDKRLENDIKKNKNDN